MFNVKIFAVILSKAFISTAAAWLFDFFCSLYFVFLIISRLSLSSSKNSSSSYVDGKLSRFSISKLDIVWLKDSFKLKKYSWEKKHEPNLTGTHKAYRPKKIIESKNIKKKYETWQA